jgi:hypothetical protein
MEIGCVEEKNARNVRGEVSLDPNASRKRFAAVKSRSGSSWAGSGLASLDLEGDHFGLIVGEGIWWVA